MNQNRWIFFLVSLGCVPKVLPGPVPVEEAAKPVSVLDIPDTESPNIYLEALIRTGSAMDPLGQEGLAAYTATGLVEGGTQTHSAELFKTQLFPTGNKFEVMVSREYTSIRLRCHIDHGELCVAHFVDALTTPQFDPAVMERIRDEAVYAVNDGMLSDEKTLDSPH